MHQIGVCLKADQEDAVIHILFLTKESNSLDDLDLHLVSGRSLRIKTPRILDPTT